MSALSPELSLFPQHRAASPLAADARCPAGPGWFESSWDLRRGLEVRESGEADVRLRTWIEDFLGSQPGALPAPAPAAGAWPERRAPQGEASRRSFTAAPTSITAIA